MNKPYATPSPPRPVVTEGDLKKVVEIITDCIKENDNTLCGVCEAEALDAVEALLTRAGGRVVDVDALTHRVMEIVRGNYHPPKDDMTVVDYDEITTVAVRDAILAAIHGEGE